MVRKLLIVLVTVLLISISGNAYAIEADNSDTMTEINGVDVKIRKMFNNRAEALVTQAQSYAAEVKRRPESLLDMSCFSDSMQTFASLGSILSDIKAQFNFSLSGNPLCSLLQLDTDASLSHDLQLFFKVPGFNLPSIGGCTPSVDVSGMITEKFSTLIGVMPTNTSTLDQGLNIAGCPISLDVSIGGEFELSPMCFEFTLPDFSCNSINQLLYSEATNAFASLTGVDLNKGVNNGWSYMSINDMGEIDVGADITLDTVMEGIGLEDDPIQQGVDAVNDVISQIGNFSGGFNLSLDLGGGISTNGSTDGLTSDGSVGVEAGHRSSYGTGDEFAYNLSVNSGVIEELKEHNDDIAAGPGVEIGTWKPFPEINAEASLQDIIDAIRDDGEEGGANP